MDYKTLSLAQYSPHPCANMSSQSNLDVDTHTEVLNQWGLILSAVIYGQSFFVLHSSNLTTSFQGAHIVLSALSVKPILERPKRQKALLFAYITLLFCLATAGFGVQAWWTQVVFIVNRDYPGGPVQFLVDNVHSLPCQAVTAMYVKVLLADQVLTDTKPPDTFCSTGFPMELSWVRRTNWSYHAF